jgi:hypothetical protein
MSNDISIEVKSGEIVQKGNSSISTERKSQMLAAFDAIEEAKYDTIPLMRKYLDLNEIPIGHKVRGFFGGVYIRPQEDFNTKESKDMESAILLVKSGQEVVAYESASKTLVGMLKDMEREGRIIPYQSAIEITYCGKKRNKTNPNLSASWEIRSLVI